MGRRTSVGLHLCHGIGEPNWKWLEAPRLDPEASVNATTAVLHLRSTAFSVHT
jgi:hypothetical protein